MSAFAKTRRKRTPAPTAKGPFLGAQANVGVGSGGRVPENGIVTGASSLSARFRTMLKRARSAPFLASTKTRSPFELALSTTNDSYAGTTPARGVGKATSFTCWSESRPSTVKFCQPLARLAASTSSREALTPAARAACTNASAGESAISPSARPVSRVSDDET